MAANKPVKVQRSIDPDTRFWAKVEKTETCWLWTGADDGRGYGRFSIVGRNILAHRYSYERFVGPIPDGLVIDHLCRTPACVNPAHLEPVTIGENTERGVMQEVRSARLAAMTHCKRGHEFTPENTRLTKRGHRICRACMRKHQAAYRQRKTVTY